MATVTDYAAALTARGYRCYPVNVYLDERGKKRPQFKGGGGQKGEYPTDSEEIKRHWDGFNGIAINTGLSGIVVVDVDVKTVNGFDKLKEAGVQLPPTPV